MAGIVPTVPSFGETLQAAINDAGFPSLTQFAKAAGTSATTISKCIAGTRPPPPDQLHRWADTLKLIGSQRESFIALAQEAKALAHGAAIPHVQQLQERLEQQEKRMKQLEKAIAYRDSLILGLLPPAVRNRIVHRLTSLEELDPKTLNELRAELEAGVDKRRRAPR